MSSSSLPPHLADKIESLCEQGCQHVNKVIDCLETNRDMDELDGFNAEERKSILLTLTDIMAVYSEKE